MVNIYFYLWQAVNQVSKLSVECSRLKKEADESRAKLKTIELEKADLYNQVEEEKKYVHGR